MRKKTGRVLLTLTIFIVLTILALLIHKKNTEENLKESLKEPEVTVEETIVEEPAPEEVEVPKEPEPEEVEPEEVPQLTEEEQKANFLPDYESGELLNTEELKYLTVGVGSTESEIMLNWWSRSSGVGEVILYNELTEEIVVTKARMTPSVTEVGWYVYSANVTGLEPNTSYKYNVRGGDFISPNYSYKTGDFTSDKFQFVVTADVQIGQEEIDDMNVTIRRWDSVLTRVKNYLPDSSFMIHLGDEVCNFYEADQYAGFFHHLALYETPIARVVGNHDVYTSAYNEAGIPEGPYFKEHSNLPNLSKIGDSYADTDGDYWFRRGNVLFMAINTNTLERIDTHEVFVEQAIAANPDAVWKVILAHHSPYTSIEKYMSFCEDFKGTFGYMSDMYGVDLFLTGHDHTYTRTYIKRGTTSLTDLPIESGSVVKKPENTALYITLSTSSGCQYKEIAENKDAAVQYNLSSPTIMVVDASNEELHMTTYEVDTWTILDEYTIQK